MRRFCAEVADHVIEAAVETDVATTLVIRDCTAPPSEFVFCGALTRRNGFVAFVEAMEILGRRGDLDGRSVRFVGSFDELHGGVDREWLGRRAAAWAFRFTVSDTASMAKAARLATGPGRVTLAAGTGPDLLARVPASGRGDIRVEAIPPEACYRASSLVDRLAGRPPDAAGGDEAGAEAFIDKLFSTVGARVQPAAAAPVGLSVCILHYERPVLLGQALDSVLAQTNDQIRLEIIIVDNASRSPAAKEALQAAAGKANVSVVALETPLPYSSALNTAAERARHPFLVFLDDDNLLAPGGLNRLATACAGDRFDVVTSTLEVFDEVPTEPVSLMTFIGPAHTAGLFFNGFGDNCMAFRRESFLRIGGYLVREGAYPSADWVLLCRAQAAGLRIGVLQQPAFRYRRSLQKSGVHWQPWDQAFVRALVLANYGDCFDPVELARVAQAMAQELGV